MLAIPDFDVVLFDVGGSLLHVAHDPLDSAIASVANLGAIDIPAFRVGVDMAVSEWRAGGGKPEHEDLTITWVRHFTLALSRSGFEGPVDLAARQIEDAFLLDGWEVDPDAVSLLTWFRARGGPDGCRFELASDARANAGARRLARVLQCRRGVGGSRATPSHDRRSFTSQQTALVSAPNGRCMSGIACPTTPTVPLGQVCLPYSLTGVGRIQRTGLRSSLSLCCSNSCTQLDAGAL